MKKNILLVDDDKIFNFLSEKTITSLGLANEITFAANGRQPSGADVIRDSWLKATRP